MSSTDEIIELKQKIEKMENYIKELQEHLKKNTNNNRHLKYYNKQEKEDQIVLVQRI
jgi:hypothetical protein